MIDCDDNMYLTIDSLIEINNVTGSNNITLRKVHVKPYGLVKMYTDKDLVEDKLYHIIDQFNENKITPVRFYSILLNEMYQFYNGHGRTCMILLANDDNINKKILKIVVLKRTELFIINLLYIKQCYQIV